MTCILGLYYKNRCYIAGDSFSGTPNMNFGTKVPKIWSLYDKFIIGYTGLPSIANSIRIKFKPNPPKETENLDYYMRSHFIDCFYQTLKNDERHNLAKNETEFIIGTVEGLYIVTAEFGVVKIEKPVIAFGAVENMALGGLSCLYPQMTTSNIPKLLTRVFKTCADNYTECRAPYYMMNTKDFKLTYLK